MRKEKMNQMLDYIKATAGKFDPSELVARFPDATPEDCELVSAALEFEIEQEQALHSELMAANAVLDKYIAMNPSWSDETPLSAVFSYIAAHATPEEKEVVAEWRRNQPYLQVEP